MCWTPAQLGAFLSGSRADPLYALWDLLAFRGLRRGEACGLEWPEVDLEGGGVTILRQRVQVGGRIIEGPPKSDAGLRDIPLDAGTVEVLRGHRKAQLERWLALGPVWIESGKVFCRENGSALDPHTVSKRFRLIVKNLGLPPIRLHDLRHGAASLMLAAGVEMKVVQETLGHSSILLTSNTYTSVYTEVAMAAAEVSRRWSRSRDARA